VTAPDQPRALSAESLADAAEHANLQIAPNIKAAIAMSRERPMTTFITGSLFLVAEARAIL
jgi:folylpolyglutamate synthase/dihydropteroate synthase